MGVSLQGPSPPYSVTDGHVVGDRPDESRVGSASPKRTGSHERRQEAMYSLRLAGCWCPLSLYQSRVKSEVARPSVFARSEKWHCLRHIPLARLQPTHPTPPRAFTLTPAPCGTCRSFSSSSLASSRSQVLPRTSRPASTSPWRGTTGRLCRAVFPSPPPPRSLCAVSSPPVVT